MSRGLGDVYKRQEIYTIHGVKKFYHTFDNKLYKVMYKSGMNNYIFIYDGAMDEVRLK